jgi:hypothetical protein
VRVGEQAGKAVATLRRRRRGRVIVALVLLAVVSACMPSWSQFRHDATGTETATSESLISPVTVGSLVVDDTADLGSSGPTAPAASPTVANGRVYVVSAGELRLWSATTC